MSNCFEVCSLPDVEIYGGDTTPWEILLTKKDGSPLSIEQGVDCTATFTLTPLKATTGLGNNAAVVAPMLTKEGEMTATDGGGTSCTFSFAEADTKGLRGKFIYQIEVRNGTDLRIGQGTLYVKQNINR